MKRNILISVMLLFVICVTHAQHQKEMTKLSPTLRQLVRKQPAIEQGKKILTLLTFTDRQQSPAILDEYGCKIVDHIGRIYIVHVPCSQLAALAADSRIERVEAEPMPQPAMDVTPGQINADGVYAGTNLPQAFTGKGVAAGVFDNGYDFTHPAFIDAEGKSRVCYYYDFCWENEDGTMGHEMTSAEEIGEYGHTDHVGVSFHGTHVMGIMAGNAVNGKYQGMAPESDIYAVHFKSSSEEFDIQEGQTSAICVLGFKYIFDQAEKDGKPCVINFSSGESYTFNHQRILESEALQALTGPGRIIVVCAGNDGYHSAFAEKPEDVRQAGMGIVNGVWGGKIIDIDIVTPVNQLVRFDFLGMKLTGGGIEGTLSFNTDSVLTLQDTCRLETTVSVGDVKLKVWKNDYVDERGDVIHVHGDMPTMVYLYLYGAVCLLTGDGPAWIYADLKYCPFVNVEGVAAYSHAMKGYSLWWPGTLPGLITAGATGYKSSFKNIDGEMNNSVVSLAAKEPGQIALFSSQGPTFEGLTKPDVTAPGVSINAPYNGYVAMDDQLRKALTDKVEYNGKTFYYMAQSGTSMATPVVSGTIALWLQANPNLTIDDIKDVFAHTCTHPEASLDYPNNTYGYGQIDAYRGLLYVLDLQSSIPELSDHQPMKAKFLLNGKHLSVSCDDGVLDNAKLTVYGVNGTQVASCYGTSIDLSALPEGVYAVQLQTDKGETTGSTLIRL